MGVRQLLYKRRTITMEFETSKKRLKFLEKTNMDQKNFWGPSWPAKICCNGYLSVFYKTHTNSVKLPNCMGK